MSVLSIQNRSNLVNNPEDFQPDNWVLKVPGSTIVSAISPPGSLLDAKYQITGKSQLRTPTDLVLGELRTPWRSMIPDIETPPNEIAQDFLNTPFTKLDDVLYYQDDIQSQQIIMPIALDVGELRGLECSECLSALNVNNLKLALPYPPLWDDSVTCTNPAFSIRIGANIPMRLFGTDEIPGTLAIMALGKTKVRKLSIMRDVEITVGGKKCAMPRYALVSDLLHSS